LQGVYELCEKIELNGLKLNYIYLVMALKNQIEALISTEKGKKHLFMV
jgi:hypothetical protein